MKTKETEVKFEELLNQLENTVKHLEQADIPLDDALKLFEKGVGLGRECQRHLNMAEKKVEILLKENEKVIGKEEFENTED